MECGSNTYRNTLGNGRSSVVHLYHPAPQVELEMYYEKNGLIRRIFNHSMHVFLRMAILYHLCGLGLFSQGPSGKVEGSSLPRDVFPFY